MTAGRSDEELIRAIGDGDAGALDALYARHGGFCFGLAQRLTHDAGLSEEIVQEAFLSIWRRSASYDPARGGVRSWLLAIVHHRAIDGLRARRARGTSVPLDDELSLAASDDPEAEAVRSLDREALQRAIARLPEEQRHCITLAYFGGLTYPEIAARLQVPLGTVKSRLRLGLEKLRTLAVELSLDPGLH